MARFYTVALCILLGIAAAPAFAALDPVDLKNFIEARFDVKNETPPRMIPWSGDMDDFPDEARDLHLACYAAGYIGSQGAMTVTINSVPVTWGPSSQTENGDGYILLVTGLDGSQTGYGSATQAWAQITGNGSTVYAVGGHALTTAIADNNNTVANANGTNNGYAMAWGGNAYNSRNAGDVYASSYNHGGCLHAFAQGGDAEDGNAGYARAWSHVLTEAFGGNATGTGNGGNAMAGYPWATTPSPGPMTARSGDAVSGNGGQGYVYLGAEVYAYGGISQTGTGGSALVHGGTGPAEAVGGDSSSGQGGWASAQADGNVTVTGGSCLDATSSADGGSATAQSTGGGTALALGGTSAGGTGGLGSAMSSAIAEAEGGPSGNVGGEAIATSTADYALATGGDGDVGGDATANGFGYAEAFGGTGGLGGNPGRGGHATATSTGGPATATGGDSDTGDGGDGTATGDNGDVWAYGGHSIVGDGGVATATNTNDAANAIGGNSESGNGGAAIATGNGATYGSAYAQGGQTESGFAGAATATGATYAVANGGNATATTSVGSRGGNATAWITALGGSYNAFAQGGFGNAGGDADARVDGSGHAEAIGGDVFDPTSTSTGDGGRADARAIGASATAHAHSGDAISGTGGLGGIAKAWGPPPGNGYNETFSGTWEGSTADWP